MVGVHQTFDAFYKIVNVIGDMCERACCHKELLYVVNKFL